jgi:hypothetical protein
VYVYPRGSDETISNVTVNGVTAHDSDVGEGIFVGGAYGAFPPGTTVVPSPGDTPIGSNITIENSSAYDVAGDGILLTMAQNGTIEDSVAHNSGDCSSCGSTPSGLWEWYCQNCTLQYNESYDNETWGNTDGGAFDIDNYDSEQHAAVQLRAQQRRLLPGRIRQRLHPDRRRVPLQRLLGQRTAVLVHELRDVDLAGLLVEPADLQQHLLLQPGQRPRVHAGARGRHRAGLFKNNIVYSTSAGILDDVANGMQSDDNIYYVATGAYPDLHLRRHDVQWSGRVPGRVRSGHSLADRQPAAERPDLRLGGRVAPPRTPSNPARPRSAPE